ncbi:hypothetical protein BD309DRAFT_948557 [Dichomitus squalens]|nr:hypothetical protein BD309DRAFT_948557 [Dichomitus squalens]
MTIQVTGLCRDPVSFCRSQSRLPLKFYMATLWPGLVAAGRVSSPLVSNALRGTDLFFNLSKGLTGMSNHGPANVGARSLDSVVRACRAACQDRPFNGQIGASSLSGFPCPHLETGRRGCWRRLRACIKVLTATSQLFSSDIPSELDQQPHQQHIQHL